MALTYLRHTKPDVAPGICYGRTDLPLAASFEQDAVLALQNISTPIKVVSSPLLRCRKLAEKIGPFEIIDDLVEMDFGTWEQVPWAEIPRPELDAWANDFLHARPHGGESVAQLRARVQSVIEALPKGTLVVTHNGIVKAAAAIVGHPKGWDLSLTFGEWITL